MNKLTLIILNFIFFYLFFCATSFAAQSTADVPASTDLKRTAREDILGDRTKEMGGEDEYIIGHGDILSIGVYGEGDMAASSLAGVGQLGQSDDQRPSASGGVRVMIDGRLSLKHVGDIEVVGMTLTELADYLKKIYATVYEDPVITTTLVKSNSLRYTIMGKVGSPGVLDFDFPLTLVQVIARSGGFSEWASKEVTVVRENLKQNDSTLFKKKNTLSFDYDDFISGENLENNIIIRSGDVIIVH